MAEEQSQPYLDFLTMPTAEVFQALETQPTGLTKEVAAKKLELFGENSIPREPLRWERVLLRQFKNPFIYLLFFASIVSFILGETIDATTILVILFLNGTLGFVQEFRAERALRALEHYLVPTIKVRRNGTVSIIPVHQLVPGDVVPLEAGDIAAADMRVVEAQGLLIDETILTGESVQVTKTQKPMSAATTELSKAENIVFSGTKIVAGRGQAVVVATAGKTVLGKIAHRIHQIERKSGYEEHLGRFSNFMLKIVTVTMVLLFLVNWFLKRGTVNAADLFLFVLALAISVVPEALAVVTTIALSRGAAKMAKNHVVVRRLSAMEDLGNIDLLCTDKTGTITENKLRVVAVQSSDEKRFLDTALLETAWLLTRTPGGIAKTNTFDQALYARASDEGKKAVATPPQVIWDLPFDPSLRFSAIIVEEGGTRRLIVRGAPEELITRSTLSHQEQKKIQEQLTDFGKQGRRTLGILERTVSAGEKYGPELVRQMEFVGFAAFEDPLKSTSKEALKLAHELGVEVRIITGDSVEVAYAIGKQVGLVESEKEVASALAIFSRPENEQQKMIEATKIFARVSPDQKFLLIQALQKKHAVGFLGEGVNDAPALELANVALVVDSATPVAREASDVVLLRHDLRVIVQAIADGRKIFENISKYLKYTLIGNFGNFYAIAGVTLLFPFIPLLPAQILLTNLLTDLPLIAVSGDRVADEVIRRPRSFSLRPLIFFSIFLGITSSMFDFLFFGIFREMPPPELRTLWFILSIITELMLIFSIRTRRFFLRGPLPSLPLILFAILAAVISIILPYWSFTREVFHFVIPSAGSLLIIGALSLGYLAATEGVKLSLYRLIRNPESANLK